MHLPEEVKKQFQNVYGDLSEELYIFFRCLWNEGFSNEEAIAILCAIIGRPDGFLSNYTRAHSKSEEIKRFNRYIAERKKKAQEGEQMS